MPIRVHQLAKEFKISTAALKKHLGDMGVDVKSHMSPVDDDIVDKIRAKFNDEVRAIKQRQFDSKSIHK
nr:translation initiation factor IF-2 N-terminal domain-containing protein [Candidatus Cloacimonadota bacterium]